jgi:hypothetical protein
LGQLPIFGELDAVKNKIASTEERAFQFIRLTFQPIEAHWQISRYALDYAKKPAAEFNRYLLDSYAFWFATLKRCIEASLELLVQGESQMLSEFPLSESS